MYTWHVCVLTGSNRMHTSTIVGGGGAGVGREVVINMLTTMK